MLSRLRPYLRRIKQESPLVKTLFAHHFYANTIRLGNRALRHQKACGESQDYLLARARHYAHCLDKGTQHEDFQPGHSKGIYQIIKENIAPKLHAHPNDPSFLWSLKKIQEYEEKQTCPELDLSIAKPVCPLAARVLCPSCIR